MISFRAVRTLCRVGGLGWLASRSISSAACQPSSAVTVGYASDVEGDFDYWQRYIHHSHVVYRDDSSHELRLRENSMFVFGGDVCDRGPGDLRIMRDIIFLKERYPDRVFIVLGNRDVNKLRLPFSLHPAVVRSCTPGAYWIRSERQKQFAQNEVKKNCQISKLHWVRGGGGVLRAIRAPFFLLGLVRFRTELGRNRAQTCAELCPAHRFLCLRS